jgi:antitoxin (DNA-binding transcriptional repressor) of toxin-antitoxin stability system
MTEMSVTEFAKNLRSVFDRIEHKGEEIVLVRNKHKIARILPGSPELTALEAMGDLYSTLPGPAGDTWVEESRNNENLKKGIKNLWGS